MERKTEQTEPLTDLTQRIAALSPEKLALLEKRLGGDAAKFPGPLLDSRPAQPARNLLNLESPGALAKQSHYELPNGLKVAHLNRSETDYVYREIFEERCYLQHGIRLPANACVFDVGAHIGLFTLFVSQHCPGAKIYAFEPLPPIFKVLRLNASLYGVDVKLFDFGLANEIGPALFHFYPHASVLSGRYADPHAERETVMHSLQIQQQLGAKESMLADDQLEQLVQSRLNTEEFTCHVKTLSEVLRETGVKRIDLLKIDVEKSELDVFDGIDEDDWPKIAQIAMEVHDIGGRIEQIKQRLAQHGFEFTVEQDAMLKATGIYNVYAVRPSSLPAEPGENGYGSINGQESKWPHLDRISDEDVSSLLEHLSRGESPEMATPSPNGLRIDTIPRLSRGSERDLLLHLNELSVDDVEALLDTLLDTPEAQEALRAVVSGVDGSYLEALRSVIPPPRQATGASEGLRSVVQPVSPNVANAANVVRPFELAQLALTRALQEASMKAQRQIEEEHFNFTWSAHEAALAGNDPGAAVELYNNYTQAVQQIRSEARQKIDAAYWNYAGRLRDCWAQADGETLDPQSLAAISQTMLLAATFAINTRGSWL